MSRKASPVLWIGLPDDEPESAAARVRAWQPGGVVLFRRNIRTARQVHALVRAAHQAGGDVPPVVALDQEGGRVDRLRELLGPSPSARRMGREGPETARRFGTLTGRALELLGIQVDFAPVLDLDHEQASGAIDDRSWGRDPQEVAELAGAFLEGLEEQGVTGCLKHWPGLGRAAADPHRHLPRVDVSPEVMEREIQPFTVLASRARLVMTAHCLYPSLGAADSPATCCAAALEPLRRSGFGGCLVADDLEMGALRGGPGEAAAASLTAGCDALLVCGSEEEGVCEAAAALDRPDLAERCREAAQRFRRAVPVKAPPDRFDGGAWEVLRLEYRNFCDPLLEEPPVRRDPTER